MLTEYIFDVDVLLHKAQHSIKILRLSLFVQSEKSFRFQCAVLPSLSNHLYIKISFHGETKHTFFAVFLNTPYINMEPFKKLLYNQYDSMISVSKYYWLYQYHNDVSGWSFISN